MRSILFIQQNACEHFTMKFALLLKPKNKIKFSLTLFCLLLSIVAAYASYELMEKTTQLRTEQERIERLESKLSKKPALQPNRAHLEHQKHWQTLLSEMNYPWNTLFKSIEKATDKDIALLQFHPDKASRNILFVGEAKTQQALENFLSKLESDTHLQEVHLAKQETIKQERLETISFEIKAMLK